MPEKVSRSSSPDPSANVERPQPLTTNNFSFYLNPSMNMTQLLLEQQKVLLGQQQQQPNATTTTVTPNTTTTTSMNGFSVAALATSSEGSTPLKSSFAIASLTSKETTNERDDSNRRPTSNERSAHPIALKTEQPLHCKCHENV
ncbi:hypothetical protein Tcan_05732 [Toxocara canis]|uniref:Uncharacterized protein n=1 Tax=Toxocara canis TaxID=6265 RepID=A0A0B2W4V1_TOXCA|nr:hypothetical protein Tcan_05732 [Toxocara canis]